MAQQTIPYPTEAYLNPTYIDTDRVLLRPRPYERYGGYLILLPLLPKRAPLPPLPAEIWGKILALAMEDGPGSSKDWVLRSPPQTQENSDTSTWKWGLVLICKNLKVRNLILLTSA